jgi:uncharacterized protein HemX
MKKCAGIILAALVLATAVPVFSQDANQEQVICNLASNNCLSTAKSIEKKMKKISADIKKGKTYSAEDLKKIEQKLKEVQDMIDKLQPKPAAK